MVARSSPSGSPSARVLAGLNMTVNGLEQLLPSECQARFYDWDYFITGGTTSGSIGRMRWNLVGAGTPSYSRLSGRLSTPIKARLSTSNANNNQAVLCLATAINNQRIGNYNIRTSQFLVNLESLATKRVFVGGQANFNQDARTGGTAWGLGYDSAFSPNWFVRMRFSTLLVEETTDLAASATDSVLFTIEQALRILPFGVSETLFTNFWAATVTAGGVVTPSRLLLAAPGNNLLTNLNVGFKVQTLAASVATLGVGYWCLNTPEIPGFFASSNAPPYFPFPSEA